MRTNRILMYTIMLLQGMVFYSSVATLYRQAQGVSVLQIGVLESISYGLQMALEIPWGFVANRLGYRRTLVFCNVLFFLSKIIFWRATGFGWFLLELVILSVTVAGLSGCDAGFLYENVGDVGSARVFGFYEGAGTVGMLLASFCYSLFVADDFGLAALLTVFTYGLAMALTLFLREPQGAGGRRAGKTAGYMWRAILAERGRLWELVPFLLASALIDEVCQFIVVYAGQLHYGASGIAPRYFGYIHVVVTLAGLAALVADRLAVCVGRRRLTLVLFVGAALSCVLLALRQTPGASVMGVVLLKLTASMFAPLRLEVQNRAITGTDRPLILSLHAMVMGLVSVILNPLLGQSAQLGIGYTMGLSALLCGVGLVLVFCWDRGKKTR